MVSSPRIHSCWFYPGPIRSGEHLPQESPRNYQMNRIRKSLLLVVALLLPSVTAISQNSLQSAFLNRRLWLRIDMPGTQLGVDIFPERPDQLAPNYQDLLRQFPPAYRAGDSATVTKFVIKKDHIEFQLDHGGFGQFGDNSDVTPVPFAPLPPSPDEIHLREKIEHEPDERDRRREQHFLDNLVQQRLAADAQNKAAADAATQAKIQAVVDRRMHGGSRFNITFNGRVPDNLTPHDIEEALHRFVSFRPLEPGGYDAGPGAPQGYPPQGNSPQSAPPQGYAPQSAPPPGYTSNPTQRPAQPSAQDYYPQQQPSQGYYPAQGAPPQPVSQSAGSTQLQKGMTIAQVEQTLGPPTSTSSQDTQYGKATTELFLIGNQVITVNYMDGVLTRYQMAPRQ